ncbi:hypothetical protein [Niabella hibiscisoli]|uniref:hypothetical protein n=1 Tax=Niabella hibiscisoli TaxID=1825928 RepID=UPI001F10D02D|nr:hypothetical protein [Niabella hibiscisoli]MCH5715025.1 hypothetical protein [Niabella hibiscisoli]
MKRFLSICLLLAYCTAFSQNANSLYLQTSEVHDIMIRYQADKGSIMRFYGGNEGWRSEGGFNTPERRDRLLKLIDNYIQELVHMPFETMNINGKADYLLFKNQLEDQQYQLKKKKKLIVKSQVYFHSPTG